MLSAGDYSKFTHHTEQHTREEEEEEEEEEEAEQVEREKTKKKPTRVDEKLENAKTKRR